MLTATFSGNTQHRATFSVRQDGGAGTTLVITNAVLLAAAPAGTPVGDMLRRPVADSTESQRILQGLLLDIPPETDKRVGRLTTQAFTSDGSVPGGLAVRATEAAGLISILLVSTAAVGDWILYIDMLHTLTR